MNCAVNLSQENRIVNPDSYWACKTTHRRNGFITGHVKKVPVKGSRSRKAENNKPSKTHSKVFELMKKTDILHQPVQVCRTFFLHTVGYKANNGNVIEQALN